MLMYDLRIHHVWVGFNGYKVENLAQLKFFQSMDPFKSQFDMATWDGNKYHEIHADFPNKTLNADEFSTYTGALTED